MAVVVVVINDRVPLLRQRIGVHKARQLSPLFAPITLHPLFLDNLYIFLGIIRLLLRVTVILRIAVGPWRSRLSAALVLSRPKFAGLFATCGRPSLAFDGGACTGKARFAGACATGGGHGHKACVHVCHRHSLRLRPLSLARDHQPRGIQVKAQPRQSCWRASTTSAAAAMWCCTAAC